MSKDMFTTFNLVKLQRFAVKVLSKDELKLFMYEQQKLPRDKRVMHAIQFIGQRRNMSVGDWIMAINENNEGDESAATES